tara:strand:+ start:309 stop:455 length:147 start_codon:yes stop_codon:yes gene_type:complete
MIRIIKDGKVIFESDKLYTIADELILEDADVKEIEVSLNPKAMEKKNG